MNTTTLPALSAAPAPVPDADRCSWSIATGVAGGSGHPSVGEDWPGGFFCPCHGSTFDLAGRVFRNKPAPTNLEIPPHRFVDAATLVIGDAAEG